MWKKFKAFVKRTFSKRFIHPVFNEQINTVVDDKLKAEHLKREEISQKYTDILNGYVRTYFLKKYETMSDMEIAFKAINKEWKKICREVNSTEKLLNLNKDAFQRQVKLVVNKLKENQNQII